MVLLTLPLRSSSSLEMRQRPADSTPEMIYISAIRSGIVPWLWSLGLPARIQSGCCEARVTGIVSISVPAAMSPNRLQLVFDKGASRPIPH